MDIGAFTALSGALTSLKTIIEIAKSVNNQQLNAAVLDVQGKLIEVQQQSLTLQQENQSLRDELQGIKDTRDTASKLRFDGKVYWKEDDPEFPFCPSVGMSIGAWCVFKSGVRMPGALRANS